MRDLPATAQDALDAAYAKIDALGGSINERDPYELGASNCLNDVLAILTDMGAMHPDERAYANREVTRNLEKHIERLIQAEFAGADQNGRRAA